MKYRRIKAGLEFLSMCANRSASVSGPAIAVGGWSRGFAVLLASVFLFLSTSSSAAVRGYANDATVGIESNLGEMIPLDLTFNDEDGKSVTLRSLVKRPTVFVLVYFRCPGICSPLIHEVAATVDKMPLTPGIDYDLITVSFDARETPQLARVAKENLLGEMKRKVPPEAWRFLTGDETNIAELADAFGYRFKRDKEDFAHPATVMFVSKNGKIVRYLPGLNILPKHMEMAIQDAAEGRARSFMQKIQRLCYAYDPEGKTYIVKVNRIILGVSLVILSLFIGYLFAFGKKKSDPDSSLEATTEEETGIADGD